MVNKEGESETQSTNTTAGAASSGGGMPGDEDPENNKKEDDKWVREPASLQDEMALDAAKRGEGRRIIKGLNDPRYKGMDKMEYKVKSGNGKDTVVHYVRDPKTGRIMDFKFKKRSVD
ncbi:hypothetical protein [Candidatus Odyssella thessalonicensis]|uniref:hypothetical protein n=1 Tax=Candidatus Odyssella thessalonicensis TaxID=84647 RepID=UPI000225BFBB|nr:hypothetical protein [Candidatus Odyssella thessalonicensis]